jgi:hypothetical protein
LAKRLAPNPLGINGPDSGWGFFMLGLPRSGAWTRAESYAIEPPRFLLVRHLGGRMINAKAKQSEINPCPSSYALEVFQQFIDRHLAKGKHDVRMFQDPSGNYFAIFCTVCDPQMIEVIETHH